MNFRLAIRTVGVMSQIDNAIVMVAIVISGSVSGDPGSRGPTSGGGRGGTQLDVRHNVLFDVVDPVQVRVQ